MKMKKKELSVSTANKANKGDEKQVMFKKFLCSWKNYPTME